VILDNHGLQIAAGYLGPLLVDVFGVLRMTK
jgi:hypothetical protein